MFKHTSLHILLCAAWASTTLLPMTSQAATGDPVLKVPAGKTVEITQTTPLSKLTLGKGASVTAPSGYSVTLTVNGVGRTQEAKEYTGDVVLTVTENIDVSYNSSSGGSTETLNHVLRTGVYVNDGAVVAAKSVSAIVQGGTVSNTAARDVSIRSLEDKFNGFIIEGDSTYAIQRPNIRLVGNGGNDFVGFGAAIKSSGTAKVTVQGAKIYTKGAVRTAVFAGGESTMTVKDSSIEAHNGTLPSDYTFTVATGKMMEVPWMLGLTGNNRATNLVGSATANYLNSTIRSQAWGALSTDDTTKVRLNVLNSTVQVVESGYGSYSIGDSINTFSATHFNVPDMALIMANGSASATFKNGSVVKSGRFGVMMHSNSGGKLIIKDSRFSTQAAVIQAKSSSPNIVVDNSVLQSANGLLIQAVVNDDPYMTEMGITASGSTVKALFKNSTLSGDIVNGNTADGSVTALFRNSHLTGAITEAATTHATASDGTELSFSHPELYKLVGEFVHTYAATGKGMTVQLDGDSSWVVSKTSYLSRLVLATGARVRAPDGKTLTMTVNGVTQAIKAGQHYSGTIVLTVQ